MDVINQIISPSHIQLTPDDHAVDNGTSDINVLAAHRTRNDGMPEVFAAFWCSCSGRIQQGQQDVYYFLNKLYSKQISN